jgi:hypothetical protein
MLHHIQDTDSKPRLFIGSSRERLRLAYAVQENLEHNCEATVWTQGIFSLTKSTLDSLIAQLNKSDYGVFILAPDDVTQMRGKSVSTARDNVIFELGLFMGGIGVDRTFFVVPRGVEDLHLPTDLLGITTADYDPDRSDDNEVAALGAACNKIRREIKKTEDADPKIYYGLGKYGYFEDFVSEFSSLIEEANFIDLMFIHSRRWRENHNRAIRRFLSKSNSEMNVFLPDLRKERLIDEMKIHFDDGTAIPGLVKDAYRYFQQLKNNHIGTLDIYLFNKYPTYTFYRFDDRIVFAMYPTTQRKKSVPTFDVTEHGQFGKFVLDDIDMLKAELHPASDDELEEMRS